jgi:ubiquitin-protein ligase
MANTKRILKELEKMNKNKNDTTETIFLTAVADHVMDLRGLVIGPPDTPFEGCFLYFSIKPENYPNSPPIVKFLTPFSNHCRMHPNLYSEGKVCLSILGTWGAMEWSPLLTFEKILLTIQGLLDNHPLAHEPSFNTIKETDKKSRDYQIQSRWLALNSVLHMIKRTDLPESFQEIIKQYYETHLEQYKKSAEKLKPYDQTIITTIHGTHKIDLSMLTF